MKRTAASHRANLNDMEVLRKNMTDRYSLTSDFQDPHLISLSMELDEMVITYMKDKKGQVRHLRT